MSKILIKNAKAIVTCNEKDEVFYDADLLIDGPKIVAIGKDLKAEEAEVIDGKYDKFYQSSPSPSNVDSQS